jgi:antirestriction protein
MRLSADDIFGEDQFDSRDVDAVIKDLESYNDEDLDEEDKANLTDLLAFREEARIWSTEWEYGMSFIKDSCFEDYAQELAEELGAVGRDNQWPLVYIDWEAAAHALQEDYSMFELRGETYWARS